jgi:hypothetical protein
MLKTLFAPQFVVLYLFAASTIYVHFRGRERLRIARQLGDHSTYLVRKPLRQLRFSSSASFPDRAVSMILWRKARQANCTNLELFQADVTLVANRRDHHDHKARPDVSRFTEACDGSSAGEFRIHLAA